MAQANQWTTPETPYVRGVNELFIDGGATMETSQGIPAEREPRRGFFCTFCGKKFTRKEHLERHIPQRKRAGVYHVFLALQSWPNTLLLFFSRHRR